MSWALVTIVLMSSSFAGIPVLALRDNHEVVTGEISESHYIETIKTLKETMDQKVVVGISAIDSNDPGWKLSRFSLGMGLTGEIGIGPYKYSGAIKQRFIYSR